mgnify:CR=1 FL=1
MRGFAGSHVKNGNTLIVLGHLPPKRLGAEKGACGLNQTAVVFLTSSIWVKANLQNRGNSFPLVANLPGNVETVPERSQLGR